MWHKSRKQSEKLQELYVTKTLWLQQSFIFPPNPLHLLKKQFILKHFHEIPSTFTAYSNL